MRLFVCVFACTSVQFLSLSVCLWWFTSLQRGELFVFQVEVEEKSTTKNIQPFSLHGFSVVLDLPDFCVFLFVCLFVNLKSSYNTLITFAQLRRARSWKENLWSQRWQELMICGICWIPESANDFELSAKRLAENAKTQVCTDESFPKS